MSTRPYAVLNPAFVAALFLLLFNDFYLKQALHNGFTGKLSDVTGLFIFPVFWSVIFPAYRKCLYALTALCFAYWKLPVSEPIIHALNEWLPFHVTRTVDATDLFALLVLPVSYYYFYSRSKNAASANPAFVMTLSAFAFMATSYDNRTSIDFEKTYAFSCTKQRLKSNLVTYTDTRNNYKAQTDTVLKHPEKYDFYKFTSVDSVGRRDELMDQFIKDTMQIAFNDDMVKGDGYEAYLIFAATPNGSKLTVAKFFVAKEENSKEKDYFGLPRQFEKNVIARLVLHQ